MSKLIIILIIVLYIHMKFCTYKLIIFIQNILYQTYQIRCLKHQDSKYLNYFLYRSMMPVILKLIHREYLIL